MSLFLALSGCLGALLFSLAGYRTISNMRRRDDQNRIAYSGRVEAIYKGPRGSVALSAATALKRAIIARSTRIAKD